MKGTRERVVVYTDAGEVTHVGVVLFLPEDGPAAAAALGTFARLCRDSDPELSRDMLRLARSDDPEATACELSPSLGPQFAAAGAPTPEELEEGAVEPPPLPGEPIRAPQDVQGGPEASGGDTEPPEDPETA